MNVHNRKHFVWSSEFYSSFVFLSFFLHEIEITQISELSFRSHLVYTPYLWLWWTSNFNQFCLIKSTRSNVLVTTKIVFMCTVLSMIEWKWNLSNPLEIFYLIQHYLFQTISVKCLKYETTLHCLDSVCPVLTG